jgi:hypothetical protein
VWARAGALQAPARRALLLAPPVEQGRRDERDATATHWARSLAGIVPEAVAPVVLGPGRELRSQARWIGRAPRFREWREVGPAGSVQMSSRSVPAERERDWRPVFRGKTIPKQPTPPPTARHISYEGESSRATRRGK